MSHVMVSPVVLFLRGKRKPAVSNIGDGGPYAF
jgi:hypothetical protein